MSVTTNKEQPSSNQWCDFNINDYVRVKLTADGKRLLRERHAAIFGPGGNPYPYQEPKEDENGWSRWQLWSLMQDLGSACYLGRNPPFETTIQFETGGANE